MELELLDVVKMVNNAFFYKLHWVDVCLVYRQKKGDTVNDQINFIIFLLLTLFNFSAPR